MIKILFITLFLSSSSAFCLAEGLTPVIRAVPITILNCDTQAEINQAQAILFKSTPQGSQVYGLTTFGSVLQGIEINHCVKAKNPSGEWVSGQVIRTSYPMGLAVIEFKSSTWVKSKEVIAAIDTWAQARMTPLPTYIKAEESFPGNRFEIAMDYSDRNTFFNPLTQQYGFMETMSSRALNASDRGGLVVSSNEKCSSCAFAMVTDNYIQLVLGQMSLVHNWEIATPPQSHLVLSRLNDMDYLVRQLLKEPENQYRLFPSKRNPDVFGIETDGFEFEPDCPKPGERLHPTGDYPIGGGKKELPAVEGNNGSGRIGGEDLTGPLCKVLIRLSQNPLYQLHGILSHLRDDYFNSDLKKLKLNLKPGNQVEVWYFLDLASHSQGAYEAKALQRRTPPLQKVGFSHLGGYFRLLNDSLMREVYKPSAGTPLFLENMRDSKELELIRRIKEQLLKPSTIESTPLIEFRRTAFSLISILESNRWQDVRANDLFNLCQLQSDDRSPAQFAEAWNLMAFALGTRESDALWNNLMKLTETTLKLQKERNEE